MKIHYTLDDSAARLPLAIRSSEGVWDRVAELRSAPGIHLVELTTQHMLNTGAKLIDELADYFENGGPSESDPYALGACYADRTPLEDLLRDLYDEEDDLIAFREVETLFPDTFRCDLHVTLALATVGFPAFGYVRTYKDSEDEEYHGLVVNLAQAHPHLEQNLGQFSLSLLRDMIRYGFFNHQGFLLAYAEYRDASSRKTDRLVDRLKDALLSRGIAWYLSYCHDFDFYDEVRGTDQHQVAEQVKHWNKLLAAARRRGSAMDISLDSWLQRQKACEQGDHCVSAAGYHAARAIAAHHDTNGLREAIVEGPDHFIKLYNALGEYELNG